MNLDIKKDKRAGAFFQKIPHGLNISPAKQQAMKDITEHYRLENQKNQNDYPTSNFVHSEYIYIYFFSNKDLIINTLNDVVRYYV